MAIGLPIIWDLIMAPAEFEGTAVPPNLSGITVVNPVLKILLRINPIIQFCYTYNML